MSLIIFIVVLSVLIVVHEYGHFITAKKLGVRVERFAVGFGPKLFSFPHDGTEFTICAIPLGGYVKMAGDERKECKGDPHEFYSLSVGHRGLIILMGPVVNFILAWACFLVVFMIGYPTLAAKVGKLVDDFPAKQAGILPDDEILQINEQEILSWEDMQHYITTSRSGPLHFQIKRKNRIIQKTIVPKIDTIENIFGQTETVRLIGIQPKKDIVFLKYGFVVAFG